MRSSLHILIMLILVGAGTLQFGGCTVTNYYVGKAIDNYNRELQEIPPWKVHSVDENTEVHITTRDGRIVRGRFSGLVQLNDNAYDRNCQRVNDSLDSPGLPCPGSCISVNLRSGHTLTGTFQGYDYQFMDHDAFDTVLQTYRDTLAEAAHYQCLIVGVPGDRIPSRMFLRDVDSVIIRDADTISGPALYNLARSGGLPLRSAVAFRSKTEADTLPLDRVRHFSFSNMKSSFRWFGLGLGIAVDAAMVAVATAMIVMSLSNYSLL